MEEKDLNPPPTSGTPPAEKSATQDKRLLYGLVLVGLLLLTILGFTDRKVLVNQVEELAAQSNGEAEMPMEPKAPPGSVDAQAKGGLQIADLPPLAPESEGARVIPQLQAKLASAETRTDSLQAFTTLIAACANLQRKDYAALYQEQLWKLNGGNDHLLSTANLMSEARDLYQVLQSRETIARRFNERAIELFARYLKAEPNDGSAKLGLAICRVNGDAPMEGITELRSILEAHKDEPEVVFKGNKEMGIFSLQTGQLEKAAARFRVCIATQPDNFEGHYLLGATYKMLNKPEEARPLFKKALSLSPDPKIQRQIANEIESLSAAAHAH